MDRLANAHVGSASTYIADVVVDILIAGVRVLLEEIHRRHDLAGLAVAALRNVEFKPGLLHRVQVFARGGEPFYGGDRPTVNRRNRCHARTLRLAIDVDRAGAALACATPELRPCHL